ncbi:thymidylate kinase [Streptomyces sp. YIM 130001]|uniref:dTMP kinase n=1 Tax=Streptomyces sp. YIM 130001 TaxID=2259644 RepID=UPI000E65A218|nr:thymidylate kinase [Streptomyces sp. YIM 130001]RII13351.1 thymidylate kinase [Streptomyces sp. YIM 130001]
MTSALPAPYTPQPTGRQGPFVVLEGVSGIGKSTLAALLAQRLKSSSIHTLADPHQAWSSTANQELGALPQMAFYLSGLLHASDLIRQRLASGPVIADRYTSSVTACHAAAHGIDPTDVARLIDPFRPYLAPPDRTFYLLGSTTALRRRMQTKTDLKRDDTDLFAIPGRHAQLTANFHHVAAHDPTAVLVDTDHRTPDQLADVICTHLEQPRAQSH